MPIYIYIYIFFLLYPHNKPFYNCVFFQIAEKRRELARKVEIAKQKERLALDSLHKCFKRAENRLTTNLTRKGAEIKVRFVTFSR